jgi:putative membrane protein
MHLVNYELAGLGMRGWDWSGGFGWPWPGLIWFAFVLLFWGGLLALLIWAVRSSAAPRRAPESAMDVLRRRLAAGEITEEEYERIRQLLRD